MADIKVPISLDPVMTLMLMKQRKFQQRVIGDDPSNLQGTERKAYIREQALALTDELHEALAEVGWKSWATSDHLNREAYLGELADVFIFFMNLMLVADITTVELTTTVLAKQEKNHKRQDDGYDGVSTKCPQCKRAYDDDAVKCTPVDRGIAGDPEGGSPQPAWCENVNGWVDQNGRLNK